ncbi:prolyl oligopeptidase family protein [Microbulbifer sp. 2205BS26-8]|uniref:prolyl oligopeptidase family serine peptidase n=1 Tax=Microbulbifer sp. 2205BS26-8 TaxID=3064386 RepID=UPI00273D3D2E|nr:prolyl oligopeptidase family serine peptidase [Microbulbifer sp. 2205BS26-8]MDP5208812.1 prolyl oligopeptidase family serine peptidase [Microbulbifer sp. 2205BS26-8]
MRKQLTLLLAGAVTAVTVQAADRYPDSKTVSQQDIYFGTKVEDPYRWLENTATGDVKDWVAVQNAYALPRLKQLPGWQKINDRLTKLWRYERYGVPYKKEGSYYYSYNSGDWDQNVFYRTADLAREGKPILDPRSLSEDGTIATKRLTVSPKGRYLAYGTSDGGTDWTDYHIRDLRTGKDLEDRLTGIKFSGASWAADESGFYYSRYPFNKAGRADDSKQVAVYFHRLGEPQKHDRLVYQITDHPTRNPDAMVSDDGHYLLLNIFDGYDSNGFYYRDLRDDSHKVVKLLDEWDGLYQFLGNKGKTFFFETSAGAPLGRVIAIDLDKPQRKNWRELVPESDSVLQSASFIGDRFVLHYLEDAKSRVLVTDTNGKQQYELKLPGVGSVTGFYGEPDEVETFFSFSNFITPPSIYHLNVQNGETELFKQPEYAADFSDLTVSQHFFKSKDGTRVPLFLVHKKGMKRDGANPTLLYGYGGFNVSILPRFYNHFAGWLDMGGTLALVNLRGGSEYGEAWHQAGTKTQKQNVFNDFIAAAEWLIAEKITSPAKLGINGRSNGGLLVGATLVQRPDLFAAALPAVGVLDMLRYHTASANARQWSSDYGLSENREEFSALHAYSPVHNTREGTCYPATLITTADRDDRVVPWHSYKFAAALQQDQGCDNPAWLAVETRAGHGAGKPVWMQVEDYANQWSFLADRLGMEIK